eukprot:COSAG01_NODE_5244_length_4388_cov_6.643740_1_plen_38_part_00
MVAARQGAASSRAGGPGGPQLGPSCPRSVHPGGSGTY